MRVTFAPRALRRLQDLGRQLFADTEDSDHAELEVSSAAYNAKGAFTRSRLHRIQDATPLRRRARRVVIERSG